MNETIDSIRKGIKEYGKPEAGTLVSLDTQIISSTRFIEVDETLTSLSFFDSKTTDDYFETLSFPLNEVCMDVHAIRIDTNLSYKVTTGTPAGAEAKIQQVVQQFSWLSVEYRRRTNRLRYNMASLMSNQINVVGNSAVNAAKANGFRNDGFLYLPEDFKIGEQQQVKWKLDFLPGYSAAAVDALGADATPTIYGGELGSDLGYYVTVSLLATIKGEAA